MKGHKWAQALVAAVLEPPCADKVVVELSHTCVPEAVTFLLVWGRGHGLRPQVDYADHYTYFTMWQNDTPVRYIALRPLRGHKVVGQ